MKSNMGNEEKHAWKMKAFFARIDQLSAVREAAECIQVWPNPTCPLDGCSQARWVAMVNFYINNHGIVA